MSRCVTTVRGWGWGEWTLTHPPARAGGAVPGRSEPAAGGPRAVAPMGPAVVSGRGRREPGGEQSGVAVNSAGARRGLGGRLARSVVTVCGMAIGVALAVGVGIVISKGIAPAVTLALGVALLILLLARMIWGLVWRRTPCRSVGEGATFMNGAASEAGILKKSRNGEVSRGRGTGAQGGFTLIEVIGVLAVLAVLGTMLAHHVLGRLRDEERRAEQTTLANMAEAMKTAMARTRSVPGAGGLAELVALELEVGTGQVGVNRKGRARQFLIDPACRIGAAANAVPPYLQTAVGSLQPVSPRVVVVSSLGAGLPAGVTFDGWWNLAEGTLPPGGGGAGEDFLVQRVDLRGLFHRVTLTNVDSEEVGRYAVDESAIQSLAVRSGLEGWYLDGTVLTFFYGAIGGGAVQMREVIREDVSYVYEGGRWGRRFEHGWRSPYGSFGELVDAFLAAPKRPDPKFGATQQSIIDEFFLYLYHMGMWAMGDPSRGIPPYDDGASNSAQQVPLYRLAEDAQARLTRFTYNMIN